MSRVVLVGVAGDAQTDRARATLSSVPGIEHLFYPCEPSLGEVFQLPLLRDEERGGHFGLPAIEDFVARQRRLLAGA